MSDESALRRKLQPGTGVVELPEGIVEVAAEIVIPASAHDLEIRGNPKGTVLRISPAFQGRAVFVANGGRKISFHNFEIEGNRAAVAKPQGLAPSDVPFARFTRNNGILAQNVNGILISGVKAREIAGFPVLVSASSSVRIEKLDIGDSGSLNAKKRNNATGGILLEEGTTDFAVTECRIHGVTGNGIWTHSLYRSPRNARGRIANNEISEVARDAIQVGHATEVRVEQNTGERIGFPPEAVDIESQAIPAALDTAGNTDKSVYAENHFTEINGKCMDLDGFHDGEIRANTCESHEPPEEYPFGNFGIVMNNSNPDMEARNVTITNNVIDGALYGGVFIIGRGNKLTHNRLLHLNRAHCTETVPQCVYLADQPAMLRTGIYLGRAAHRPDPARENTIEDNQITGYGMGRFCIEAAPGVKLADNTVARNDCSDDATVNARNRMHEFSIGRLIETLQH